MDTLIQKEDAHQAALNAIKKEMNDLTLEKVRAMNKLTAYVPIRAHQIHIPVDVENILDLKDKIVISSEQLIQLHERVQSIEAEKEAMKQNIHVEKRESSKHDGMRQEKLDRLKTVTAKLEEIQTLKFGKPVDLDKLDMANVQPGAQELKDQIASFEKESRRLIKKLSAELKEVGAEHHEVLQKNTQVLREVLRSKERINASDVRAQHVLKTSDHPSRLEALSETQKAQELLVFKTQEMNKMKEEVQYLSSHRGRSSSPIQSLKREVKARPGAPFTDSMFHIGEARSVVATPHRKHSMFPAHQPNSQNK